MVMTSQDQATFTFAIQKAMELSQARLKQDPKDWEAMYALGVSHGLRANYDFMVRKAWIDAIKGVSAARKLHLKVVQIKPDFVDARLTQGIHDYIAGSLPAGWRMLSTLVGQRGNREHGIQVLESVAREGRLNRVDAQSILPAIYRREKHPEKAVPLLESLSKQFPRNYLYTWNLPRPSAIWAKRPGSRVARWIGAPEARARPWLRSSAGGKNPRGA